MAGKYHDKMPGELLSHSREGASITEFCGSVGITRQTFHNWVKRKPEFADAYQLHKVIHQAYWERKLRTELMTDKTVNSMLVKLYFANCFGWHDKAEVDNKSSDGSFAPQKVERHIVDPKDTNTKVGKAST
jgi:hypothetical protein